MFKVAVLPSLWPIDIIWIEELVDWDYILTSEICLIIWFCGEVFKDVIVIQNLRNWVMVRGDNKKCISVVYNK